MPNESASAPNTVADAVDAAVRIVSGAAQSGSSLRRRLERRGFSAADAAAAAEQLRAWGYLDDRALAESVTRRRIAGGYGRARVSAELSARGLDRTAIDGTLQTIDPAAERASATDLAHKWVRAHGVPSDARDRSRLAAMLQRRGFSGDCVADAIRSLRES